MLKESKNNNNNKYKMVTIKYKNSKEFYNSFIVETDSIDDVINELIPKIRKQYQDFYKQEIINKLKNTGSAIIDKYAGMGAFYSITLTTFNK